MAQEDGFITITKGFFIRLIIMLVIFFIEMDAKIKVSILFLLDAVDCGYTQLVNFNTSGHWGYGLCNDRYYIIGDEFLDILSYFMAYHLLQLDPYYFILVGLRIFATAMFILTGNRYWFLVGPDAFKELVLYSWIYPLNVTNITLIIAIKMLFEYYFIRIEA